MLVLTRKADERILIGEDIVITIIRIGPSTVKVGIDAPVETQILREELSAPLPASHPAPTRRP